MREYLRSSEIIGHVVLDVTTGEEVGRVRDVVFRPGPGAVVGLTVDAGGLLGGRNRSYLRADEITHVGEDAVTIESAGDTGEELPGAVPEDVREAGDRDVLDDTAYTDSGRQVGTVVDVVIGVGSGIQVVAYEIEDDDGRQFLVRRSAQRSVSGDALVLRDDWDGATASGLDDLPEPEADRRSKPRRGTGTTRSPGAKSEPTKQDLYERARRLDVDGRSKMSKAELADAVARAETDAKE